MADLRDNVEQWRRPAARPGGSRWGKRLALVGVLAAATAAMLVATGTIDLPWFPKSSRPGVAVTPTTQQKPGTPPGGKAPSEPVTAEPEYVNVPIKDRTFKLELAADDAKRFKGLSDRTEIPADGGMLFVFPFASKREFVMRDCPAPIDIIFLDGSGRVTAFHKMQVEEPRRPEEPKNDQDPTQDKYEARLKRYSSKYSAQFVIELKGNTLDELKLTEGDPIKLDTVALKKRAK